MRKTTGLLALALVIAACGGSSVTTTSAASAESSPTVAVTTTVPQTTTTAAPETTTTPAPEPTTTGVPETTTTGAGTAQFVLSTITLGASSPMVVITNIGDAAGSLAGHWLCQRPSYYMFPDVELAAGERAAVSVGGNVFISPPGAIVIDGVAGIGPFDPASGEVGLYSSDAFSNPAAILSYVEWGEPGHGRSGTAVSAGIWPEGGFVATSPNVAAILAVRLPAVDPGDWSTG